MTLTNWLRSRSAKATQQPARRRSTRLGVHQLEDRAVPSAAFGSVLGVGSDTAAILPYDNAVDAAGNTYVTGLFYGTMDFDPSGRVTDGSDVLTPRGSSDAFVAKYAPDNSLVWARRMGGDFVHVNANDPYEKGTTIAVDTGGNVYVTGDFVGPADFGAVPLTGAGSTDAFVAKLDAGGTVAWAKSWGGSTREHAGGVAVDASGNVVAVGSTADVLSNGAWIENGFEVHKYTATGAAAWTKRVADRGGEADSVATDAAGNVFLCGSFAGTVDFNPDPRKSYWVSGSSTVSGGGGVNGYVLKLTAAGAFGWVAPLVAKTGEVSSAYVNCTDIAVDGSGNVVFGGQFNGPADFDPSSSVEYRLPNTSAAYNGYVEKLSPTGSFAWAMSLGGASVHGLAVDTAGSVYAIGTFSQVFTPGGGLPAVTSNGGSDVFVTKLSTSGTIDWAVTFGGTGDDLAYGIAVDTSGSVYCAGAFRGTVDFDSDPNSTYYLNNPAYADMFLLKLRQN